MRHNKIFTLPIVALLLILYGCEGGINNQTNIPDMPVSLSINIMQDAPTLNVQGGYIEINEPLKYGQFVGYGGIVIFHGFDDYFYAFDMSCPHECKRDVRIECSMAGMGVCPKCGSTFDIGFGTGFANKGPSKYPLRRYQVMVSGYNIRVTR